MCYLEAEVRPNEKDQFLKDLKEAYCWVRKSNTKEKVYVKKFDPYDFGWVEYVGIEKGEYVGGMCILAMFHGCYKPVTIANMDIDKELVELRNLMNEITTIIEKYKDRDYLKLDVQHLKAKEQELLMRVSNAS